MQASNPNKFVSKVDLIKMYDQPFDIIEIYVDGNESYPNPYGFSVRILRALYILNNKIVFKY